MLIFSQEVLVTLILQPKKKLIKLSIIPEKASMVEEFALTWRNLEIETEVVVEEVDLTEGMIVEEMIEVDSEAEIEEEDSEEETEDNQEDLEAVAAEVVMVVTITDKGKVSWRSQVGSILSFDLYDNNALLFNNL